MTLNASILGLALFATQGASEPVKSPPEFFVTAGGDNAHLWVREGNALRVVGHGVCKDCQEGDGHDHGKPVPKK